MGLRHPLLVGGVRVTRGRCASYSWAVCEPTTGELLAEVTLDPADATLRTPPRNGHADAAGVAEQSVRRFAAAVLGITVR